MNDSIRPPENPFSSPQVNDQLRTSPDARRQVHPLMIFALLLASVVVGGCTFFCTCLGVVLLNLDGWFLGICAMAAILATIGTFVLAMKRARRSRSGPRAVKFDQASAADAVESDS